MFAQDNRRRSLDPSEGHQSFSWDFVVFVVSVAALYLSSAAPIITVVVLFVFTTT